MLTEFLQAYARTLSKHHPWAVRTAAHLSFYALPYREKFLLQVKLDKDLSPLESLVRALRPIVDNLNDIYTQYDLHALP